MNNHDWVSLGGEQKKQLDILEICVVYDIVKTQQLRIILRYKRGIRKYSGTCVNA